MLEKTGSHLMARIAVGCVLGAATVAVMAPTTGAHAVAIKPATATNSCETINVHDDGWDKNNNSAYGNRGYIFINSSDVIFNLHDAIFRNFFVTMDSQNFVEGGWFADPAAGYSNPTVYYLWMNRGATNGTIPYTGYILTMNTDRVFTIENVGDIGIFRFFVDDEQNPYAYSPMMDFQNGYIQTNSERWNSCDSMWAHFYDLNYYNTVTWTSSYDDLECYTTTAGGYFFNKISNSEHTINQFSGDTC